MTGRDLLFYPVGLVFLFLAKAKHTILGYSTPKPFGMEDADRCVAYDIQVVDDWLVHLERYTGESARDLVKGKRVLELGPGSDLGTGIYLLGLGADRYNACDVNSLASEAPDGFYDALLARLESFFDSAIIERLRSDLQAARAGANLRLNYVVRQDFDILRAFGPGTIELVFSQASFEHFDDIEATVAQVTAVCRPGAVLVAGVDLKTHSRWIRDKDPNNIYRYHPALYRAFHFRGSPNRLRPRDYVQAFERHGWKEVSVVPVTRVDGRSIPRLHRAFRDPAAQMELLDIVLCARRPS